MYVPLRSGGDDGMAKVSAFQMHCPRAGWSNPLQQCGTDPDGLLPHGQCRSILDATRVE